MMVKKNSMFVLIFVIFLVGIVSAWTDNGSLVQSVDGCGILNTTNAVYTLASNVSSADGCFNITAINITFDGNGYTINYSNNGGDYEYGIYSNASNSTIKNFIIKEGLLAGNIDNGIHLINSNNSNISNNTIIISGERSRCIYATSSSNNVFYNNNLTSTGNNKYGILLSSNSNLNYVSENTINFSGGAFTYGFYLEGASNNTFIKNSVIRFSNYGDGMRFTNVGSAYSKYNNVSNNTFSGVGGATGLRFYAGSGYNNFYNNTIITDYGNGIQMDSCVYNNFTNNSLTASSLSAVAIAGTTLPHFDTHTLGEDNLVQGLPINYTVNIENATFDGVNFSKYGQVIFAYSKNITIRNSNFSNDCLSFFNTSESIIENNNMSSNNGHGIFLYSGSTDNFVSGNMVSVFGGYSAHAVVVSTRSNSNTFYNNTIYNPVGASHTRSAFWLINSNNSRILNNNITTLVSAGTGVFFYTSSHNLLVNNTIITYGGTAHGASGQGDPTNNTFSNNTIVTYGTDSKGIIFPVNSGSNSLSNMRIYTNGTTSYPIYAVGSSISFNMTDSILNANRTGVKDINISSSTNSFANLTNVSRADGSPINISWTVGAIFNISNYWWLSSLSNYTNGSSAENVSVSAADSFGNPIFSGFLSDSSGRTEKVAVLEYVSNGSSSGTTYFSNYTLNATRPSLTENFSESVNMTTNREVVFTFDATSPNVTLISPANNTYTNSSTNNLTTNMSDGDSGIKNATLYVYNETDLVYEEDVTGFGTGSALSFDGVDDYTSIPKSITSDSNFTISFWAKRSSVAGLNSYVICDNVTYNKLVLYFPTTGPSLNLFFGSGSAISGITLTYDDVRNWGLYTLKYDGSDIYFYFNGVLKANTTRASTGINGLYFGNRYDLARPFNGSIDEVTIFNRSLNSTEIEMLYNSGRGLYADTSIAPFNEGLVAGYHFDETSGAVATDIIGANNGTIVGATYTTGIVKSTSATFDSGIINAVVGTVVDLVDGIYKWFYRLFDWAGNQATTQNNTLVVDTTYPQIEFVSPTPSDGEGISGIFTINSTITDTNLANTSFVWDQTTYNITNPDRLKEGLVAFYKFSNNSDYGENDSLVYDYSGSGNNGTVYGDASYGDGIYDNGMEFDGIGDYVITFPTNSMSPNSSALCSWFFMKNFSSNNYAGLSAIVGYTPYWKNSLQINSVGNIIFESDSGSAKTFSTSFSPNIWNYVCLNRINGTSQIYANGIFISSASDAGIFYWNRIAAADVTGSYTNFFNGSIDEVMIYNRSLSADEIKQIYDSQVFNYPNENVFSTQRNFSANTSLELQSLGNDNYNFLAYQMSPNATSSSDYSMFATDSAGNINSTETRLITGNQPPVINSVTQNESDVSLLDPGFTILITANISDAQNNLDRVWLELYNSSGHLVSIIYLENQTEKVNNIILNNTLTLPLDEDNYIYRIVANDTIGADTYSENHTISNFWDCTWNISRASGSNIGGFFGWEENKNFANFTIYNTGDIEYQDSCPLIFSVTGPNLPLSPGSRFKVDNSAYLKTYSEIIAGQNITPELFYKYYDTIFEEQIRIDISEISGLASIEHSDYITADLISTSGPYLYQTTKDIWSNSSGLISKRNDSYYEITLSPQVIILNSTIRNGVGDGSDNLASYNTTLNWTYNQLFEIINITDSDLDESFTRNMNITNDQTNLSEEIIMSGISFFYNNISDGLNGEEHFGAIQININNSTEVEINNNYYFEINSMGFNQTGDQIVMANNVSINSFNFSIMFNCYQIKDDICFQRCSLGVLGLNSTIFDPDCGYCGDGLIQGWETCTNCVLDVGACPSTNTGSSGGGGGGGGAGGSFDKSEATFELVRGEASEFYLTLENKLSSPKKDITVRVSGDNSQYFSVPSTIDLISPNSKKNLTVKITAPSYFPVGQYLIKFDFTGTIAGNTTSPFTETKYVTLRILEISRKEADELLNSSEYLFQEMNNSGFITKDVNELLSQINSKYNSSDFGAVRDLSKSLEDIYNAAIESNETIAALTVSIAEAEKNGIQVSETKKLLYLAQILFNRGDYLLALEKLKEANLTYNLETKGEFKILYAIKNNPLESLAILISITIVGTGSTLFARAKLLKRKLRVLEEEEKLLLGLMKVIQRDCFENNKMSMEEYESAMMQYEKRLSEVIQDKIKTETLITNLMKLKGKKNALSQERDRLQHLIMKTQDDYMNKGKLDTRIYGNMLKTYATRLNQIEEELIYMEAKDELKKFTGLKMWRKN